MTKSEGFSIAERVALLDACQTLLARHAELGDLCETAPPPAANMFQQELQDVSEQLKRLFVQYEDGLPVVELSRCPFTADVWVHSLDYHGLDGFWWSRDNSIRPLNEPLGGKHFAFTGAARMVPRPAIVPFVCCPGPELPYVIPRLLEHPAMKAVVSSIMIGPHQAYPVVYFSAEPLPDLYSTNDWGATYFVRRDEQGEATTGAFFDADDSFDFELESWIDADKLMWIAPDDDSLTLRDGVAGCPYLSLPPGRRQLWYVQDGEMWWDDEDDDEP